MAVIFDKNILQDKVYSAFNNNIVEFFSNDVNSAVSCSLSITVNGKLYVFTITPDVENNFYFNFKEICSKIAKENKFKDEATTIPLGLLPYDLTFSLEVDYVINLSNDTTDESLLNTYTFYKSISQINEVVKNVLNPLNDTTILSKKDLTIWFGYPFDISIYSKIDVVVLNPLTGIQFVMPRTQNENRFFLSNGDDFFGGFETRVSDLVGGFIVENSCYVSSVKTLSNIIKINSLNQLLINGQELNITTKDYCSGIYLKWFEPSEAVYSYWLFEDVYRSDLGVGTKGMVNVDFTDINETFATKLTTGKGSEVKLTLNSKNLTANERNQLKGIFTSPRVEMYLKPYRNKVLNYQNLWETVTLDDGSFFQGDSKRDLSNIQLTIKQNHYSI